MEQIKSNQITMKPRWYFMLGSLLMFVGLVSLTVAAVFLTNLTFFFLKQHGPMGDIRLQQLLTSFPIWVPAMALFGTVSGLILFKKFDFSYKRNPILVAVGFIAVVLAAAILIDTLGLNNLWRRGGPMRWFYQLDQTQAQPQGYGRRGLGRSQ